MRRARALPLLALVAAPALASAADPPSERQSDLATRIRPLLSDRCFPCHGPDAKKRKAGLRLDTLEGLHRKRDGEVAVVPGRPDQSALYQRLVTTDPDERMPPGDSGKAMSRDEIELVRAWIAAGAPYRGHWAFEPVRPIAPPPVARTNWPRNEIDRFVLARLEAEGLQPSPEADAATLLRRAALDLTGLPPTPAELDAFLRDSRAGADAADRAYGRAVDRLLASPAYAERWARTWLDLARYADSNGYSIDSPRSVWKYRDWVVDALDRDLPFDRFVVEQLAGDLLPDATAAQKIATGFQRNTPFNEEGGIDLEQFRVDAVADRVNTAGAALLGLTLGCARCHDHKYDPISQQDYFQLFAFWNDADDVTMDVGAPDEVARSHALRPQLTALERELKAYESAWWKGLGEEKQKTVPAEVSVILSLGAEQRDDRQWHVLFDYLRPMDVGFRERITTLEALRRRDPRVPTTLVLAPRAEPRPTHVHAGGDFTRPGAEVVPGVPAALPPLPVKGRRANRLDLARWIVDRENPLSGRVAVNRMWQAHFGLGLVETENDFGTQGALPSHPELLDWLTDRFYALGLSQKALHRLIVTSATYRQSSKHRAELAARDPANRLLGRQNRLRLDAELIRDTALAASGLLTRTRGGPPVRPPQPPGVFAVTQIPRVWIPSTGADRYRRGLYTFLWRSAPYPAFTVFDLPDPAQTCTRRNRSTLPTQALTLLNDPAHAELAHGLGLRLLTGGGTDGQRLREGFRLVTGRPPSADEATRLEVFLRAQRAAFGATPDEARKLIDGTAPRRTSGQRAPRVSAPELAAWIAVGRVLLNLDETVTRG